MVELLNTACGISTLGQLVDWLAATKPPGRSIRSFPMNQGIHQRLPDKPGVYRMLRAKKGDPLYIGKAKSLKQRVNSYFRQKAPHAEHTLEMLTQARELDFTLTGSALEAAMLESDEIKRRSPPYNIALRRGQRGLVFFTKDLCRHSAVVERAFPVGPLPAGKFIKAVSAFGLWLAHGMQVNDDDHLDFVHAILALPREYAPEIDCMREGSKIFRENYGDRLGQRSALRLLTALGAQFWRERLETAALAEVVAEKENDNGDVDTEPNESGKAYIWTPGAVARSIEKMVLHSAHLIRRARWFCLLSESSLVWSSADHRDNFKRLMVLENGSLIERDNVKTGEVTPTPPGFAKSFRNRQKNINLITYDRLRVVTTELRRLVSEGRDIELHLGPKVTLHRREVISALRWV
jgi:DNA polymerase-3 subunit epsilon